MQGCRWLSQPLLQDKLSGEKIPKIYVSPVLFLALRGVLYRLFLICYQFLRGENWLFDHQYDSNWTISLLHLSPKVLWLDLSLSTNAFHMMLDWFGLMIMLEDLLCYFIWHPPSTQFWDAWMLIMATWTIQFVYCWSISVKSLILEDMTSGENFNQQVTLWL